MLLRHLITQFLQHQAKSTFAEVVRDGATAKPTQPPHAIPLLVDGLMVYPTDLEAGGALDLTKEKETAYCEAFTERTGIFASRRVALLELGDGPKANKAMAAALQLIQPLWVVSFGFASGLADSAKRGQIVMASRIVNQHGAAKSVGLSRSAGQPDPPGLHFGDLLTVDRLPTSLQEKKALAAGHAVAWDADSYFIAEAIKPPLTMISVRIISEAIDDQLPPAIKSFQNQKSLAGKLGAATGALLDRPSDLKAMWKLRDDAIRLSDRLAKFLEGVISQLPCRSPNPGEQTASP